MQAITQQRHAIAFVILLSIAVFKSLPSAALAALTALWQVLQAASQHWHSRSVDLVGTGCVLAGFTPAEEVEEVDTSQEQPQGLAAFVSKLQGFSQSDPFYAIVSYKDFKPETA